MKVGGEVSAPKPKSVPNVKWPTNSTQCYELGVAVFEGVVDRNGNAQEVKLIKDRTTSSHRQPTKPSRSRNSSQQSIAANPSTWRITSRSITSR